MSRSSGPERPLPRSVQVAGLYALIGLAALLIGAWQDDVDLYRYSNDADATRMLLSPVLGLAVGLAVVLLSRFAVHRYSWARELHQSFRALLGKLTFREALVLALASSIGEELLFRGALLPLIGLWWQAGVFALLHIGPSRRFLPWTGWAFAMGIVFGAMTLYVGDIGGAIVAHFVINFLNLRHIVRVEFNSRAGVPHPR